MSLLYFDLLHIVVKQNGHLECVKWLVEEGGVPMVVPDSGGETLLHYSAFHGQAKILEWLLDRIRQRDDMDVGTYVSGGGAGGCGSL